MYFALLLIITHLKIRYTALSGHKIIKESKVIEVGILGDVYLTKPLASFLFSGLIPFPGIHSSNVLDLGFHIRRCMIITHTNDKKEVARVWAE